MDWGSKVTYLGSTTLKERTVNFGVKDTDRLRHFCILGKSGSGRAELIVQMALQDIERGIGTILLDASGKVASALIERIDPSLTDRIVYLDPAIAEYPYSWNPLDDIRTLPSAVQAKYLTELLVSLYNIQRTPFVEYGADVLLRHKNATLITFHTLTTDEKARESFFEKDESGKKAFEEALKSDPTIAHVLEEEGRYVAKDSLVRNLLGQEESRFTLGDIVQGKILIVDFSHIHIFPTRMTPLVRVFVDVARMVGSNAEAPIALSIHDCLRYLSEKEIDRAFSSKGIAINIADTIQQESDRERREFAISRCGSIASFATHPSDKALIERVFYPYADSDELVQLGEREMIVALSIDAVRARPFFAHASSLPERKHVSYQDVLVACRSRYTIPRTKVDALFKKQKGDGKDNAPPDRRRGPGGFQDAFRSIMASRAQNLPLNKEKDAVAPKDKDAKGEKAPDTSTKEKTGTEIPAGKKTPSADASPQENKKNEVPEEMLKKLLFVRPVAPA